MHEMFLCHRRKINERRCRSREDFSIEGIPLAEQTDAKIKGHWKLIALKERVLLEVWFFTF